MSPPIPTATSPIKTSKIAGKVSEEGQGYRVDAVAQEEQTLQPWVPLGCGRRNTRVAVFGHKQSP
jgi:hypothetical protein